MEIRFRLVSILLFSCCCITSYCQNIIGTVKSVSGKSIAFATVSILNTLKNETTDNAGNFSFKMAKGEFQLIVSATGFNSYTQLISAEGIGIKTINVILTGNNALLEEVVVTGTKTEVAKSYVPFNISVVNREQIENSSESSLLPLLSQQVPGLFVTQRGITGFGVGAGSAGAISMRGLSGSPNNRVLVLINGNPQFMGIFGHPLPDAYVASDVKKVEVIHGAGSVLYGSNAMGGVINIITRNQQQDGYSVNGRILYGSFNTQKYLLNAGFRKKAFSVMVSLNNDRTDGHRPNAAFNITNGFLKLNYQFAKRFSMGLESNVATYKTSDPGPSYGPKGQAIDIFRGSTYFFIANNSIKTAGNIQLYYNYGNHAITDGFRSQDANYGFSVYQTFKSIKNNATTVGFDVKNYGGKASNIYAMNGQGIVFGNHTISEWAPYVFSQQTIANKIILSAGFRLENNSVYGSIPVPSSGVSYLVTKRTTLKAAVSKGFRSPAVLELYLFPPANAALQPEKMISYEVSIRKQLLNDKILLECALFNVQGVNQIQTIFEGGAPKNVNSGVFNNTGIEISTRYSVSQKLVLAVNYAYTAIKNPVIGAPASQLAANGTYRFNKFDFNLNVQHIAGLYKQVKPVTFTSNYLLLNAKAGYTVNSFVDVFLKGENLTNESYQINNGYTMPGITILGGINFHLSKLH